MSTERYTTSKFVRGEFRIAADNKIDLEEEPYQLVDNQKEEILLRKVDQGSKQQRLPHHKSYERFVNESGEYFVK